MIKRKTIFYIGNIMAKHGNNTTFNYFLIPKLGEFYHVLSASDKKNKVVRLLDMMWSFTKARRKTDVLIIDVYSTINFWYACALASLALLFKIPYINILRGGDLPSRLVRSKKIAAWLFGCAYINISPSTYLEGVFKDNGFKVGYIPNFVEIENYVYKPRRQYSYKLFWLRAFDKIYNPILAVKVLKSLVDKGHDAQLCMVGPDKDGSRALVEKEAENLGVKDRLKITGRLGKEQWIKLSEEYDIFINTTNFDNMPLSVMEIMALGLPIVSTNAGGLPYLIDDKLNGILVPCDDDNAFVEGITSVVNNPQMGATLAKNARDKVETFTWPALKGKWVEVIDAATKNH